MRKQELWELGLHQWLSKLVILLYWGYITYWGYIGDNGKEDGNYYNGLYWGYIGDNGKENGNYTSGLTCVVPFWVPIIVQHLIFRVTRKGP